MKLSSVIVTMVAVLASSLVLAQPSDPAREADHEALRALRDKVVQALETRDMALLESCLAREFVITTVDQSALTSMDEVKAYFARMFDGPDALVARTKIKAEAKILTRFVGPDAGYCYGTSNDTYELKSGRTVVMPANWTATVVREDGQWKVAAVHGGVSFMDNPVLERSVSLGRRSAMLAGIGGIAVGLLLGGVVIGLRRGKGR